MFMCAPLLGETLVACCVSTSWHKIQWQKRGKVWLLVKLQREEALAQAEEACLSSLAHMFGRNQELQQSSDEAMTQRTESAHCTSRPLLRQPEGHEDCPRLRVEGRIVRNASSADPPCSSAQHIPQHNGEKNIGATR